MACGHHCHRAHPSLRNPVVTAARLTHRPTHPYGLIFVASHGHLGLSRPTTVFDIPPLSLIIHCPRWRRRSSIRNGNQVAWPCSWVADSNSKGLALLISYSHGWSQNQNFLLILKSKDYEEWRLLFPYTSMVWPWFMNLEQVPMPHCISTKTPATAMTQALLENTLSVHPNTGSKKIQYPVLILSGLFATCIFWMDGNLQRP